MVPLKAGQQVVGRQHGCELRVPVASVSRQHCAITLDNGSVKVRDLGSSNGTFVNGEKIESEREMAPGDLVSLGAVLFVIRIDGAPAEVDGSEVLARAKQLTEVTSSSSNAAPTDATTLSSKGGLLDDLGSLSSDGSSMGDFEFDLDLDDDDDDQPEL